MRMSKYTVVLHELLTNEETKEGIQKAMSTYPIYEPVNEQVYGLIPSREELNNKILNRYRRYEIGSETVGEFLINLETALNLIMPYYNQLYKSLDIMNGVEDIFENVDITETFEEETNRNSSNTLNDSIEGSSNTNTTSIVQSTNETETEMSTSGRNVGSKTPQSQLSVTSINNITSASEINWNEENSNSTSNSTDGSSTTGTNQTETSQTNESTGTSESNGTTTHTLRRKGNQGVTTYAHDIKKFRDLSINIEKMIVNDREIATCFMTIW